MLGSNMGDTAGNRVRARSKDELFARYGQWSAEAKAAYDPDGTTELATLVQQEVYPGLSPLVRVHAPLGPDLVDYLSRIARYNRRPKAPTDWRLDVHAGPDFLDRMRGEPPGGIAIFSGRNRGKIERIIAALETGLHVLADNRRRAQKRRSQHAAGTSGPVAKAQTSGGVL